MSVERRYALLGHTHEASGGGTWGSITGTLSDQTDLQSALNGKLSLTGGTLSGSLTLGTAQITVDYGASSGNTGIVLKSSGTNKPAIWWNDGTSNIGGMRFNGTTLEIGTGFFNARLSIADNGNVSIGGSLTVGGAAVSVAGHTHTLSALTDRSDLWNDMDGATHGAYADFNVPTRFGPVFIQSTTNGPGVTSAQQYYAWSQGLGSNYTYAQYAAQFAIPRAPLGGNPVLSVRYRENGTWGAWQGVGAGLLQNGVNTVSLASHSWRLTSTYGYGNFGSENSGWFHMSTDRAAFYMGNALHVNGSIYRYNTNYAMDSDGFYFDASANRIRATSGSYGTGELYGSKNGWAGLRIVSASGAPYLMWSTSSNVGGIYSETNSWMLYYTGSQWQGPSGQALLMSNFSGSGIVSRGTAAPSGGSDGDIYLQYT